MAAAYACCTKMNIYINMRRVMFIVLYVLYVFHVYLVFVRVICCACLSVFYFVRGARALIIVSSMRPSPQYAQINTRHKCNTWTSQ